MRRVYVVFGWCYPCAQHSERIPAGAFRYVGNVATFYRLKDARRWALAFVESMNGRDAAIWSLPKSTFRSVMGWDKTTFQNHPDARRVHEYSSQTRGAK